MGCLKNSRLIWCVVLFLTIVIIGIIAIDADASTMTQKEAKARTYLILRYALKKESSKFMRQSFRSQCWEQPTQWTCLFRIRAKPGSGLCINPLNWYSGVAF